MSCYFFITSKALKEAQQVNCCYQGLIIYYWSNMASNTLQPTIISREDIITHLGFSRSRASFRHIGLQTLRFNLVGSILTALPSWFYNLFYLLHLWFDQEVSQSAPHISNMYRFSINWVNQNSSYKKYSYRKLVRYFKISRKLDS